MSNRLRDVPRWPTRSKVGSITKKRLASENRTGKPLQTNYIWQSKFKSSQGADTALSLRENDPS